MRGRWSSRLACSDFVTSPNEYIEYALKGSWFHREFLGLVLVCRIDTKCFTYALY
jgi:hypothetical protein